MINVQFLNLKDRIIYNKTDNIQIYYSFNKYFLSSYYKPGSVPGSADTATNQRPLSHGTHIPAILAPPLNSDAQFMIETNMPGHSRVISSHAR